MSEGKVDSDLLKNLDFLLDLDVIEAKADWDVLKNSGKNLGSPDHVNPEGTDDQSEKENAK